MKSYGIPMIIAFLCSVVGAKAETPTVTALSDGIAAFICDEIDNIDDVPLIFTNDENNWNLRGSTDFSVSKIENGFKFISSGAEEGFGFLKMISRNEWNFEYLDQKGFYETSCTPQDYFVDLLVEHISPKIIENGNTLVETLKNANTELTAMTLALEAERKEAEITLTKIAAANALEKSLKIDLTKSFTENQLNELQGLLDESKEADTKAQIQLKSIGTDLNLALARVAAYQRKNAILTKEIESLKTEIQNK